MCHAGAGDGPHDDARTRAPPRTAAGVAPQPPAMGVRGGSAAAFRRPRRGSRLRPPVAGRPGRRGLGGGDLARGLRRAGPRPGRELRGPRGTGPGPRPRARGPDRRQPGRARPCSPTAPTIRRPGGCRRSPPPESSWCQLFSEPDAGSDLAAVRTAARRVDGGWQLDGRKVWTSYAQFADWGVCLARSDPAAPKHKGLSFFVGGHARPGGGGPSPGPAHRRSRVQRSGAHRGVRARRPARGGARGGLAGGRLDPVERARGEPPAARDPPAASRGAPLDRRRPRARSTTPACAASWPRRTSRCACSSSTTGDRSPSSSAGSSRAPKEAS